MTSINVEGRQEEELPSSSIQVNHAIIHGYSNCFFPCLAYIQEGNKFLSDVTPAYKLCIHIHIK